MKETKQYHVAVSVYGTLTKKHNTAAGIWHIAETTEEKAIAVLRDYLKQHNLFGTIQFAFVSSETPVSMERGQVLSEKEYSRLAEEQQKQKPYEFIPRRANGHLKPKLGTDADKAPVQGAYGSHNEPTYIEDCGNLPYVDGVTYEGQDLENFNLDNMIDELDEER